MFIRPGGKDASAVPMFADAINPVGMPLHTDRPPDDLQAPFFRALATASEMQFFTVARHGRAINIVFLDGHGATTPLEDLWRLKWHSQWISREVVLPPR
jgi:prepilin-type processing-associated H-X9-DG protein